MRFVFVEPNEAIEQLVVEGSDALKQFVEPDERFLEDAVEALGIAADSSEPFDTIAQRLFSYPSF